MSGVRELRPGLWHWQAPHPGWSDGAPWPREVSSYAIDEGERLLLVDPLAVPVELLGRETIVVLTAPWHERDTRALVGRLRATVFAPPPDTAEELMAKFSVTAEQAGDGSPDLRWIGSDDVRWYAAGDRLPIGIEAYIGREHNDLVLWHERAGAIIAGDTLVDFGSGLALNPWLRGDATCRQVAERLWPLLGLPVQIVCPAHGAPTGRAALERALAL
jgi:glyoxylase-like metal-dependent hydrolase (beta-lactamase superfamily II)